MVVTCSILVIGIIPKHLQKVSLDYNVVIILESDREQKNLLYDHNPLANERFGLWEERKKVINEQP